MIDLQQAFLPIISKRSTAATTVGGGSLFGIFGASTKNGVAVNATSALTLSAFYNGIEIITNDFAKLPKAVYQKKGSDRLKMSYHPVQYLISTKPNQYMTSFMFDKMMLQHAILKGNGYAYIERDNYTSQPNAFQLINQDKTPVTVIEHNDKLFYQFNGRTIAADDMIHVPGFSFNGITGISVITAAANSLGVALSSQEFGTDYYKAKGVGTGIVTTPKTLDADAKRRYAEALGSTLDRAGDWKMAVVDEGGQFQHLKITPQEAQFLATNKYGIEEVARWLNIPPHKLKSLENVNNSITENQEIQHVNDSIIPWKIKIEQEYNYKLFTDNEIEVGYYVNFDEGALLRADKATQATYFSTLVNNCGMTRNEVRAMLDMNALPGLDEPLQQVNTMTEKQFADKLEISKLTKKPTTNE